MKFPQVSSLAAALLCATLPGVLQTAQAHGYLVNSRAHLCNLGSNTQCGPIQWEPQSVEGLDRYPETGAADGTIASGGNAQWAALNEQSRTRWSKISLKSGAYTFQWQFTAPHVTRDIRYWITKANWNPALPLSRAQFEAAPFCQFQYNNTKPVPSTSERANHPCMLPARSGYHLILAVWDVADTVNSFYSVMDANFDGGVPPALTEVGKIFASADLPVGATASTRVFNKDGELPALSTTIKITTPTEGLAAKWPRALATSINAQNNGLKAGALDGGVVTPVDGANVVYVANGSAITRVEVTTKLPPSGNVPVYPAGIGSYVAGSKVQGRDGKVYVCLEWPYTSWCNGAASYYEPGFGSAWQQAWKPGSALK